MNEILKQLSERTSVRLFDEKEVSDDVKQAILNGAINAPTAGNMQLYSIIDVTDQAIKDRLAVLCDHQSFIANSKICLIFVADYFKWQTSFKSLDLKPREIGESDLLLAMEDSIIAAQNAVVAAHSLGLGSCYIGDIMENSEEVVKLFNLPKYTYPACMLVMGYPKQHTSKKPARFDNQYIIFENTYKSLDENQLERMFKQRSGLKGYRDYMQAFMERKHNSDFSHEMKRSAKLYIEHFLGK